MTEDHHRVVVEGDPEGDAFEQLRGPAGLPETTRARRLARAARAGALSLPEVTPAGWGSAPAPYGDARWQLTDVAVKASGIGGYIVELRFTTARAGTETDLRRAIGQHVRQAADDRGLGPYLELVTIVVEDSRP
jgi:hypothetical protein